ncbi:MAG: hypothetical protein A2157_09795 [Deltaproteobacteria bacterium RBG_16_47_11]|nr:MAG: hypothetical protein A2157_09795 [Deltaproteobacteria bacterium RBG_16_47_11]
MRDVLSAKDTFSLEVLIAEKSTSYCKHCQISITQEGVFVFRRKLRPPARFTASTKSLLQYAHRT